MDTARTRLISTQVKYKAEFYKHVRTFESNSYREGEYILERQDSIKPSDVHRKLRSETEDRAKSIKELPKTELPKTRYVIFEHETGRSTVPYDLIETMHVQPPTDANEYIEPDLLLKER